MTFSNNARSGYAAAAAPIRTDRGMEYHIFAKLTHRLKALDETDRTQFPVLAEAVADNSRLWGALAADLASEGNSLPDELRGQLISLSAFVFKHSHSVLSGKASVEPLIDINASIMRGLRGGTGEVEAAA